MDKHVTCDNRDELNTQPVVRGCRTADHNERFPNPLQVMVGNPEQYYIQAFKRGVKRKAII